MPFPEMTNSVLAAFGALGITGAVAAGAAYWLFKTFAKSWLDSRFEQDLEKFRAQNAREVERLKAELGRYADRATRFHVREYEVLPEAWGLMNKAFGDTHHAVSPFQQLPDLDGMSQPQLELWLKDTNLTDLHKLEISSAESKNDRYFSILTWMQIIEAEQAVGDFHNYVIKNGVFIDDAVADTMISAAGKMKDALVSRTMAERNKGHRFPGQVDYWVKANDILGPIKGEVQSVKDLIKKRLSDIRPPTGQDHR